MKRQIFLQGNENEFYMDSLQKTPTKDENENVIIYEQEMQELLHEWDIQGNNDLCINGSLAERIRKYLEYQKELDPLRIELAKRIYTPFARQEVSILTITVRLTVDKTLIGKTKLHLFQSMYNFISLSDFKIILLAIGNPYATWIPEDEIFVNLQGYIVASGGTFQLDNNNLLITT